LPAEFPPQRPQQNVLIVTDFDLDVQTYAREFSNLTCVKPRLCPNCSAVEKLVGHGSYQRQVCDHTQALLILVKRLLCKICRHTVSLLPAFCLPYRHYHTSVIQKVLSLRIQGTSSWSEVRRNFLPYDLPALSTCREWTATFSRASGSYLSHLLKQLAEWQLAPGKLELAIADISLSASAPGQLLSAVPHLLAWLRHSGFALLRGTKSWLETLWQWGHGVKLGRLV